MPASQLTRNLSVLRIDGVVFVAVACILYAGLSAWFAATQSIWVDETTQLSGLTLTSIQQARWLAGIDKKLFVVPDDRMPPLSYFLGWAWASAFGLSEDSLRWLGIVCVTCGIPGLWLAARRMGGVWGAMVVVLAFSLSPNLITVGGEIRAYPIFLMISCWTCWAFIGFLQAEENRTRWGTALWFFGIFAAYTHFFGAVMAGAVWLASAMIRMMRRQNPLIEITGGLLTGLCFVGLVPFILAAFQLPSEGTVASEESAGIVKDLIRLCYRLIAHPASSVHLVGLATLLSGTVALAALAMLSGVASYVGGRIDLKSHWDTVGLILVIAIGIALSTIAAVLAKTFNALSPNYNIWLLPFLLTLLSAASRMVRIPRMTIVFATASSLFILGSAIGAWTLSQHRLLYSHGPSEWVFQSIDQSTSPTIIVHDKSGAWGFVYFPIAYSYAGKLEQFLKDESGNFERITPKGLEAITSEEARSSWSNVRQIWVRADSLGSNELAEIARRPLEDPRPLSGRNSFFPQDGNQSYFNSFVRAEMTIVEPGDQL